MITANGGGKYIPMRVPTLERGRQKRKQETGVKFISCFFTLQKTTEFYWGERTQERIRVALPLSQKPQISHFLGFLPVQQSVGNCESPGKSTGSGVRLALPL